MVNLLCSNVYYLYMLSIYKQEYFVAAIVVKIATLSFSSYESMKSAID